MRTIGLLCLVLALAGCATKSRYADDPRARCVGPAYLEYIDQHPPQKETQYFYPVLAVSGGSYLAMSPTGTVDSTIQALLTVRPNPTADVQASTGKGWPELEAKGMPFHCGE
jgi:hypothetical protein